MSELVVVAILGSLILVHELGHLLAARAVGIPVARFSIGFGPAIWSHVCSERFGSMELRVSAFPLGGYVLPAVDDDRALFDLPLRSRLAFYAGGPAANLLVALPLFAILNTLAHGPSLHGTLLAPWGQLVDASVALVSQLPLAFAEPESVSGLVGIVVDGGRFVGTSAAQALQLAVLLSLNLAVLNLLPIPVLDGGKILLHCLHAALPRTESAHLPLSLAGLFLVGAVMVAATYRDVVRLLA